MDDIRRKLELIDRQLAGPKNRHKQIISTCPLLFAAVGLVAGIITQTIVGLSVQVWLILLALCAVSAVLFFAIQRAGKLTPYALVLLSSCALICFVCLGAVRLASFYQPRQNDIRNFIGGERKLATIRGLITTKPRRSNRQWKFAKFKHTDPGSSFYLSVDELKTVDGWIKAGGLVRVQVNEPVLDLKAGDRVRIYCWLQPFKEATNPGQFNTAKYLARRNVFIGASVKLRDSIKLLETTPSSVLTRIRTKLRETASHALSSDLSREGQSKGLVQALLLGYRRDIDRNTYRAFRRTGLLHFISLSGLHLGILVGIIWWLCKMAGLMKRARATVCIIAIVIFLLIVPPRAPTLRAAIICFVFCASFFFRRHSNPLNTLSLAAIILLLIRPTQLFEAGWQLSFASVLGILFFTYRIQGFLYEQLTGWFWSKERRNSRLFFRIIAMPGPFLLRIFAVGISAWLGSAGVLLYHFYVINPLTSIWTVVAFPLVALILTVGYLKIILSFLLPTFAQMLGIMVTGLADLMIWLVKGIAALPISQILIGHVSLTPILLYYCIIVFAAFAYFRRPVVKKTICTALLLPMIVFLGITKWQRTHRDNLVVTTLDVSHGQAILAQFPGQANVLFDAGSLFIADVGTRIVAAFLDYSGINKVDAIVISHNDVDHINGIPEIVEHCKVGGVYANDAFLNNPDQWKTGKFLKQLLSESGLEISPLKELALDTEANIRILWPSDNAVRDPDLSDNDRSAVSLMEFGGSKVLLCSDIEKFAQGKLLELFPGLRAEVVVVPHHGSPRTLRSDFLGQLEPEILIYSCSRKDYDKLQTAEHIPEAQRLYTPKDGAITICVDNNGSIKSVNRY